MRQTICSICILLFSLCIKSQVVQVVNGNTERSKNKIQGFVFLQDSLAITKANYVATLKVTGMELRATLPELYFMLKHKANFLGANSFKGINYNERGNTLQLDVFYLNDTISKQNDSLGEKNCIYLFGREKASNKTTSFKLNGEEKSLRGGQYYKYVLNEGQEVRLEKGGALGSKVTIKWAPGKGATFVGMEGFRVLDPGPTYSNSSAVSFSPASLTRIEPGLGYLLKRVLKPATNPVK